MNIDEQRLLLIGGSPRSGFAGFMSKVAAFTVTALVLVGAFMVSLLVFAVAAILALLIGSYIFWKTRAIRKQLRDWPRPQREKVIEGEVIQSESTDQRSPR